MGQSLKYPLDKYILGVTGGVGAGKSRILQILKEEYGFHVIQADQVAKDLMRPGTECFKAVVDYLGTGILGDDGGIDRGRMAAVMFGDPVKRGEIDRITHPQVWKKALEEIRRLKSSRVVMEAAIPSKEFRDNCSEMWYVYTSEDRRIARLQESRGYAREKSRSIMENQVSEDAYRAFADAVIDNNCGLEETRTQVQRLLEGKFQINKGL